MVERVPSEDIEQIVGARRARHAHYARAVSETETVYILHSGWCKEAEEDLRNCEYSRALARGIDQSWWAGRMDTPVVVAIREGRLVPFRAVSVAHRVDRGGTGVQRDAEARKDALLAGKSANQIVLDEASQFMAVDNSHLTMSEAFSIKAPDGTVLLKIKRDGTWEVDTESAPEAAKIFLDEMVKYSERLKEAEAAIEKTRHILTHDEPMMLGSIEQDMERNPDGEGGTVGHKPSTPGWGGTGCPGRAFVVWRDRALAALDGQDPPVPGRSEK